MTGNRRRRVTREMVLFGFIAGLMMLSLAGQARAAGPVLNLGPAAGSEPPSVAVDTTGNALITWSTTSTVKYCVLPRTASRCSQSGTLTPAAGENEVGSVTALMTPGTDVILADTFGSPTASGGDPVQMWTSTDDGASFTAAAGGLSVGSAIINGDTVPVNGVVLPGGVNLGFGFETAIGAPSFSAFSATAPTECSSRSCAMGFATLASSSDPDQVGNLGAQFAADDDSVMGIFDTNATSGSLGCSAAKTLPFGVAYVFGDGVQDPTNDYNISPGQPASAWRTSVAQASCNTEYPAVGGGPSGFGLLEQDDVSDSTVYQRFDSTTQKFDVAPVTIDTQEEREPALSQDNAGGIYATLLAGSPQGPVSLAYSANGGKTFVGPATLTAGGAVQNLTSRVNASGQGFAVWLDGRSIYAQTFAASDALVPATIAPTATSTATTVTTAVTCSAVPCTVNAMLSAPTATVTRVAEKKKAKTVTLGSTRTKITKKGSHALTVKLNARGRKLLARHHGALKLTLGVAEKAGGLTATSSRSVKVKAPKVTHHKQH